MADIDRAKDHSRHYIPTGWPNCKKCEKMVKYDKGVERRNKVDALDS